MNRRREGWPISRKYCRASFIAASTASEPLPTKNALVRPAGACATRRSDSSSIAGVVKNIE